ITNLETTAGARKILHNCLMVTSCTNCLSVAASSLAAGSAILRTWRGEDGGAVPASSSIAGLHSPVFIFHSGFAQTMFAAADTSGTGGFSTRADCVPGVSNRVPITYDPVHSG